MRLRKMNWTDLKQAPDLIQRIHIYRVLGFPVGMKDFQMATQLYPEYFEASFDFNPSYKPKLPTKEEFERYLEQALLEPRRMDLPESMIGRGTGLQDDRAVMAYTESVIKKEKEREDLIRLLDITLSAIMRIKGVNELISDDTARQYQKCMYFLNQYKQSKAPSFSRTPHKT